jgi:hypothetical protein
VSVHEAIDDLLRKVAGVSIEAASPDWLDAYRLPNELRAAELVGVRKGELAAAEGALEEAESALAAEAALGRLLYEQGKDALEPAVRFALSEVGAVVEEPEVEGIEDGRLTDPGGRHAMLEIKGRRGQLKLEDVRQLDGWMRTAMAEEAWDGKGLIVANLKFEESPRERDDPIAPNALAFAQRTGIAILTTSQLHLALRQVQEGNFVAAEFWDAVFAGQGLIELPAYA